MSPPPDRFDTEELLAQLGWVRALARRVAGDDHGAEDLTQDAMLVALRGGTTTTLGLEAPLELGAASDISRAAFLRRWLAAVVRNLGRTSRRSVRRRAAREALASDRELSPSTLDLVERASTHRELVGALLELDEPYRTTLLMRFFEECSLRKIAERTGVPVSTVSTRIADGLARLRRRFAGRETWLSSLLPFFRWPREVALPALTSGAVIVSVQIKLILGAVVLVGGLIGLQTMGPGSPAAMEVAPQPEQSPPDLALADIPIELGRQVVEPEPTPTPAAPAPAFDDIPEHAGLVHTVASVRGRVIDLAGAPVGGVEVCRLRPAGSLQGTGELVPAENLGCVTSDAAGQFETEGALPFTLNVQDAHYTTLYEGVVRARPGGEAVDETLVIVAPRIPLAGIVVDEHGAPIADVRISLQANVSRPGLDLSTLSLVLPEARSDELGAFAFEDAPEIEHSMIQFQAPGYAREILPLRAGGDGAMVVVLSREGESPYQITGHVRLEDGSPAVGAYVSTGSIASSTDEQGVFVIDLESWLSFVRDKSAPVVLTAITPGLLPASMTLPSVDEARESGWPKKIVLVLAGQPLTMRGIVVDELGEPLPGVLVEPADPSEFGFITRPDQPAFAGIPRTQEQLAGGGVTTTGDDGRFELEGLLDRDYSLRALSKPSLLCVVSDPIHSSDQNVRIVLDRRGLGTIEGRIVDRHGEGIEGVRVAVSFHRVSELVIGASGMTDADGVFRIADATTEPEFLRIEGTMIVPELFRKLDEDADVTDLELQVGRRCRIQFDWGDWPGREDELIVFDERGERLTMMRLQGNSIGEVPSITFRAGVSDVVLVSDAATHAVVYREGEELMRVPLSLLADELNLIQL